MNRFIIIVAFFVLINSLAVAQNCSQDRREFLLREIQKANSFITDASLLEYKYQAMMESAFAFYRATNHLYYEDISQGTISIPKTWKQNRQVYTWLQGDFHIQNIGFLDREKTLIFDLNDYDESYVGPYYWDLIRLLASLFLVQKAVGFSCSNSDIEELAMDFLKEYESTLKLAIGNECKLELATSNLNGFVQKTLQHLKENKSNKKLLKKWTKSEKNIRTFDFANSDLAKMTAEDIDEIEKFWPTYLKDIASFYTQNPGYFKIKDKAVRLHSGLGSLGVKKYYILLEGTGESLEDDLILEVKEERATNLLRALDSPYPSFVCESQRVKTAYQSMRKESDPHVGTLLGAKKSYFVSKISPWKYGFEPADFTSKSDMANFLKYTAQALALAHSRSDNDFHSSVVPYNFEKNALKSIDIWPNAKTEMRELARKYSKQVEEDYKIFQDLVESGKLRDAIIRYK